MIQFPDRTFSNINYVKRKIKFWIQFDLPYYSNTTRKNRRHIKKAVWRYECAIHYPKITRIVGRLNCLNTIWNYGVGGLAPPHLDICVYTCALVILFFFPKEEDIPSPIEAQPRCWEKGDRGGWCGLGSVSGKKLEVKTSSVVNSVVLRPRNRKLFRHAP